LDQLPNFTAGSRDPGAAAIASHVSNLKRDLRTKRGKTAPKAGLNTPADTHSTSSPSTAKPVAADIVCSGRSRERQPAAEGVIVPSSCKRVLLIEDNAAIAAGIIKMLRLEGMDVDLIDNGTDAVGAVERSSPDLVLLDMRLPDLDGSQVYNQLRGLWSKLPIIISSGSDAKKDVVPVDTESCLRFLTKPYGLTELVRTIDEICPRPAAAD
jgi:CheY-like chemotaxis protein